MVYFQPENVLIDIDGHVKLADFGLAKIMKDKNTYSFCGSPEYMSPEMLKGEGHSEMVDFYSLGAILYEMLTGLPPHYSQEKNEMYIGIIQNELDLPDYLSEDVNSLM
jgi:serum/glucocorticoid-regulated kinase 2